MSLDNMTLNQLRELALTLGNLEIAGSTLGSCGLEPVFDLTPGQMVMLKLPFVMPDLTSIAPWRSGDLTSFLTPIKTPEPSPLTSSADVARDHFLLPVEPLAADVNTGEAGDGGVGQQPPESPAIAEPTADPVPVSNKVIYWTVEEDARFVAGVVDAMTGGASRDTAIAQMADELGRPYEGSRFRLRNKLAKDFDKALALSAKLQAQPKAQIAEAKAAAPVPPPALTKPAPASDALDFHLAHLTRADGWTMARDIELLELTCNGWQVPEIAMEMQIGSREIKARFDLLTGLFTDANDKQARRFKREDVLSALTKRAIAA